MKDVYNRMKKRITPEMRTYVSNMARELLKETPESVKSEIRRYADIKKVVSAAYKLYMPQIESEIIGLTDFLMTNTGWSRETPINILEIGTKFGGTFYIWNEINRRMYEKSVDWDLNGENEGKVISIDMSDGGKHGGISEEEMDKRDLWFLERFENCHFVRGNSHDSDTTLKLAKLLYAAPGRRQDPTPLDFLFIDGDHTYEGVKRDFEMYSPFVRKGGIVAFHDIVISEYHHGRDVYVGEFWNDIKNKYTHYELVELGNNWGGIGICIL